MLLPQKLQRFKLALIFLTFAILIFSIFLWFYLKNLTFPQKITVCDLNNKPFATIPKEQFNYLPFEALPQNLIEAFLAVEDHRFFQHHGINWGRVFKAAVQNFRHRSVIQGASTITQQLAKNLFLNQERSWLRKFREFFITIKLETAYSKNKLLEMYLNRIYFGHGAYGVAAAARLYFNREINALNPAECAFLAVLPKGPALYSPFIDKTTALKRHRHVLNRLYKCNFINSKQLNEYLQLPLRFKRTTLPLATAPYFLDFLQEELLALYRKFPKLADYPELIIESSIDLQLQAAAEKSLTKKLPRLVTDRQGLTQPQGAFVALCPKSAEIRVMIGGSDYRKSQFNRAAKAQRQPGSAFKPLLYAAALENGYTLASRFETAPQTYSNFGTAYTPNDDHISAKTLSLREALASSNNVIAVKILNQLKPQALLNYATNSGISSNLPASLSLALGSGEVTLLELSEAYLPFAANGLTQKSSTIRRIRNSDGELLYERQFQARRILSHGAAFLITSALRDVFKNGGTAAAFNGKIPLAAGKTGTSENNRDVWFIGYTDHLLSGLYLGCDRYERPLPYAAGALAAPIWVDFMSNIPASKSTITPIPSEVVSCKICIETSAKATAFCPRKSEYFLIGTQPSGFCQKHRAIYYRICQKSNLLASDFCSDTIEKPFNRQSPMPERCQICKKNNSLWDFLKRFSIEF